MGMISAFMTVYEANGKNSKKPSSNNMYWSTFSHVTKGSHSKDFQPMNINFGLLLSISNIKSKKERYLAYTNRAKLDWNKWIKESNLMEGSLPI